MFPAGTKMIWKTGKLAYEKTGSEDFDWWRSHEFDLDKPLEKRYGFKWTDQQVKEYYNGIMSFELPTTNL